MKSKKGKCIVVSAPSGAGKTTIVHSLLEEIENLSFSISACSRLPRKNEENGKDYHFISLNEFKEKINKQEFIEWEEVYKDSYYGTLKQEVYGLWDKGKAVVFDVDVIGGINIKNQMKEQCLSIFISPLHIDILEKRLRQRQTES
ncbi:MAG: guanylate kinase, partial [Crocinitomicaceae bacterium]|nr:guanylate kinase [Crocinitomicaceae bacterium]